MEDFKVVKSANPLKAITATTLRDKFQSPTMTMEHWRRFVCNLPTRASSAAITEAEWFGAKTDEQIPAGESIWVGLDVSWKWDTTAVVPFWMNSREHRLLGPATVLIPPRDGSSVDQSLIERALTDLHERNPIHTVVMDTSRAEGLASWIESELGAVVVHQPQANPGAVRDFEMFMEALRSGWLHHAGDPGLTQHALNAIARVLPFGDARFDRPIQSHLGREQERRVIDALTAASMVHSTAALNFLTPAPAELVPLVAWR